MEVNHDDGNDNSLSTIEKTSWLGNLKTEDASKITKLLKNIKNIRLKNLQYEICINSVEKFSKERNTFLNSSHEIDNIILSHELSNNKNTSSLGLQYIEEKLPYDSRLILKCCVSEDIKRFHKKIFEEDIFRNVESLMDHHQNKDGIKSLDLRSKLLNKYNECNKSIVDLCVSIRKILEIKTNNIELLNQKIVYLKSQLEMISLKQKVTYLKLQNLIFKETSETEKAVDLSIEDLRYATNYLTTNVMQMEKELNTFENMSPTSEMGKLVKKYIKFKEEIKRIELLIKSK